MSFPSPLFRFLLSFYERSHKHMHIHLIHQKVCACVFLPGMSVPLSNCWGGVVFINSTCKISQYYQSLCTKHIWNKMQVKKYWNVRTISELLSKLGLDNYKQLFASEEIDLSIFLTLNEDDLVSIGVSTLGARRKMLLGTSISHPGNRGLILFFFVFFFYYHFSFASESANYLKFK